MSDAIDVSEEAGSGLVEGGDARYGTSVTLAVNVVGGYAQLEQSLGAVVHHRRVTAEVDAQRGIRLRYELG
jgi:hypothetical protein